MGCNQVEPNNPWSEFSTQIYKLVVVSSRQNPRSRLKLLIISANHLDIMVLKHDFEHSPKPYLLRYLSWTMICKFVSALLMALFLARSLSEGKMFKILWIFDFNCFLGCSRYITQMTLSNAKVVCGVSIRFTFRLKPQKIGFGHDLKPIREIHMYCNRYQTVSNLSWANLMYECMSGPIQRFNIFSCILWTNLIYSSATKPYDRKIKRGAKKCKTKKTCCKDDFPHQIQQFGSYNQKISKFWFTWCVVPAWFSSFLHTRAKQIRNQSSSSCLVVNIPRMTPWRTSIYLGYNLGYNPQLKIPNASKVDKKHGQFPI